MGNIAALGDESMRMYDWWFVTATKVFCDSFKRAQARIGALTTRADCLIMRIINDMIQDFRSSSPKDEKWP